MEQNKAIAALQSIILALCMVVASYSFAATEESNKEPGSLPAAEKPDQGPSPAAPAEEQPSPAAPAERSAPYARAQGAHSSPGAIFWRPNDHQLRGGGGKRN